VIEPQLFNNATTMHFEFVMRAVYFVHLACYKLGHI